MTSGVSAKRARLRRAAAARRPGQEVRGAVAPDGLADQPSTGPPGGAATSSPGYQQPQSSVAEVDSENDWEE